MIDAYVINLKKRSDRWISINDHTSKRSKLLNLKRFEAFEGNPGGIYCALSHIQIVKNAKKNNLPYVLVLEDDNIIKIDNFDDTFSLILSWLNDNKNKWDIFNGNPIGLNNKTIKNNYIKSINTTPIIIRYKYGKSCNFIIYNKSSYDKIISLEKIYKNAIKTKKFNYPKFAYDKLFCNNLKHVTSYPYITSQCNGYSNISKKEMDFSNFFSRFEKYIYNTIIKNKIN